MSLLHLAPVITSTVSLWFAFDQYFFLGIFLHKDVEPRAKHVLTPYWNIMIATGLQYIIMPLLSTIGTTSAILYTGPSEVLREKGAYPWYVASAIFAAGHFAFVPVVMPKIKALQDGGLTPTLQQWMRIHVARSVTVDFLCWVTSLIACSKALSL